jgi:tumor protein p53-inducible protein 3
MLAIVVTEPGGTENLRLVEVPDPELRDGHVLIDVKATALNRADLLQRRGAYPPPKGETDILGLECAGVVAKVGAGVGSFREGDRVMALLGGGGYAERVVVHEKMAIPIPERLGFEEAAAIPEAFLTAREALFTLGRVTANGVVLIHAAAGGVGSAAVQLAKIAGARVVATAGSAEKVEKVRALGAHTVVNYRTEDFAAVTLATSEKRGADAVLDFVGASYFGKHASCLAVGGRLVVIGVMGGTSVDLNLGWLLMRRAQILGLVMRSRPLLDKIAITQTFIRESLPLLADGSLRPIIDCVLPLSEAAKAHDRMEANENVGKIVLKVGSR